MIDPPYLTNPCIPDFPHLLKSGAKRDIPEEAEKAMQIAAGYTEV